MLILVVRAMSAPPADFRGTVLTSKPDDVGYIFPSDRIPRGESWRATVKFRLTAPPGQAGADGIAIFFSTEQKLGQGGYGLGYSGIGTTGDFAVESQWIRLQSTSVAELIEVDTFCSYDFAADPAVPHISVHSPPDAHHKVSVACTKAGSIPPMNDGREYTLDLLFDGRDRKLWGSLIVPAESRTLTLWETTIPSPKASEAGKAWWIGMTGSCGGLWQKVRSHAI